MKFVDFLDAQNFELNLKRHPNREGRWSAVTAPWLRVINGEFMESTNGHGDTPDEAIAALADCIQGKRVEVVHNGVKREILIPSKLEHP